MKVDKVIYLVLFKYGDMNLWSKIERLKINKEDSRSFNDLASEAVSRVLNSLKNIEQDHIAHDFEIFISENIDDQTDFITKKVYSIDTLINII